jgi:hypothetical protein
MVEAERLVQIRQALPARVHLLVPRLAWHREACERVARALAETGAYARVTVRVATGSILVEGDGAPLAAPAIAARVQLRVVAERDEQGRPLASLGPEDHPGPTRIARAVVHAAAGINTDVRVALDDRADLGTLLPVFFAAAGLVEAGSRGELPVPTWFNLLWWSLRSFMTFNIRAVEEEVQDGKDAGAMAGVL